MANSNQFLILLIALLIQLSAATTPPTLTVNNKIVTISFTEPSGGQDSDTVTTSLSNVFGVQIQMLGQTEDNKDYYRWIKSKGVFRHEEGPTGREGLEFPVRAMQQVIRDHSYHTYDSAEKVWVEYNTGITSHLEPRQVINQEHQWVPQTQVRVQVKPKKEKRSLFNFGRRRNQKPKPKPQTQTQTQQTQSSSRSRWGWSRKKKTDVQSPPPQTQPQTGNRPGLLLQQSRTGLTGLQDLAPQKDEDLLSFGDEHQGNQDMTGHLMSLTTRGGPPPRKTVEPSAPEIPLPPKYRRHKSTKIDWLTSNDQSQTHVPLGGQQTHLTTDDGSNLHHVSFEPSAPELETNQRRFIPPPPPPPQHGTIPLSTKGGPPPRQIVQPNAPPQDFGQQQFIPPPPPQHGTIPLSTKGGPPPRQIVQPNAPPQDFGQQQFIPPPPPLQHGTIPLSTKGGPPPRQVVQPTAPMDDTQQQPLIPPPPPQTDTTTKGQYMAKSQYLNMLDQDQYELLLRDSRYRDGFRDGLKFKMRLKAQTSSYTRHGSDHYNRVHRRKRSRLLYN